ncbi:hypothetical protein CR532_04700 (plasmid) [Candidatus Borreliella tachyglossi]|uniref:Lipoprotein n=2 Tax=Candidatus Borreliella tachyglossi TaxID=1964448 RepID=A0A2S1LYG2_9SPIR|nr:hypothetical protein CR532_04700 [Candidatus Borreliella tachyglossi]
MRIVTLILFVLMSILIACSNLNPGEEIEIIHESNLGKVGVRMTLTNNLGSLIIYYNNDNNARGTYSLDFNILADIPLNLLRVSFNDVPLDPNALYDPDEQLPFDGKQYKLPFDDSITKTGFLVKLDTDLGEHLRLAEFARGEEGLKFNVECVERESGIARDVSFDVSLEGGKQFFNLIDQHFSNS